jgi:Tfp pilus assembly protein PilF
LTALILRRLRPAIIAGCAALALVAFAGRPAQAADTPRGEEDYRAGWYAWAARKYDDALAALERAVAADSGVADYRESLGYMQYLRKQQRSAESTLKRAARQAPKEPRIAYLLAQMYGVRYAGDPEHDEKARELTLQSYQQAIALDPDNGFPQAQYASVLFDTGRDDEAIKALDAALAAKSFRLYLLPTPAPREAGEYGIFWEASLGLFAPAVARFNNLATRCRRRAALGQAAGDAEQAKADLNRAAGLGRLVAAMEPRQLASAVLGLGIDRRAQRSMAQALRASDDAAGAQAAADRADALDAVIKAVQEEARAWTQHDAVSAQDMRERETKLAEKALGLAYPTE